MGKQRFLWILCVVAVETTLLLLAVWQYNRMQEKQDMAATMAERPAATLHGSWQVSETVALDNQPNPAQEGQVGWRILTPLKTASGTVVVDRGWMPHPADRTALPDFSRLHPTTPYVSGVWQPFPERKGWLGGPDTTTNARILAWLNPAIITSATVGPVYLQATTTTTDRVLEPTPPPPPRTVNHASYALQWLVMALVFPLLCWGFLRRRG